MKYKAFTVAGTINETELDGGLVSLTDAPVHIDAILINVDAYQGNIVEGWIGNERVLEIYDYVFDTADETAGATAPYSSTKINRLPVDLDIPPGQAFKIGINSGAAASDIFGAYEYTPAG